MSNDVTMKMPRYKCHKEVEALQIKWIEYNEEGAAMLQPVDTRYGQIEVSAEYADKHNPQPGGYYVVYSDGYESFSPAKAFEDGYTLIS